MDSVPRVRRPVGDADEDSGVILRPADAVDGAEDCVADPGLCYDAKAIQAPDTAEIAPPGYYMLFILDENRVPSIGKIVKLER